MIRRAMISLLAMCATALAQPHVTVPVGGGANGIEGLKWVPVASVNASLETAARADGESPAVKVTFKKEGDERRFLALEAIVKGNPTGSKVLAVRYRLNLTEGQPAHLALLAFSKDGGAWFKVSAQPITAGGAVPQGAAPRGFQDVRLPLTSLRRAQFSRDAEGQGELKWDQIEKVWFGLAIDGPAQGTFEVSRACFTSEPYRPSQPLKIPYADAALWHVGKDQAAEGNVTIAGDAVNFQFSFPGGRHMYDIPHLRIPEVELEGYKGLCFTYKAELPNGINGLLVMLRERDGTQYCAEPPPPAAKDWKTVAIPFGSFKKGGWCKDENDRLDLDQIDAICIGVHGTTTDKTGKGFIIAKDVQFAP